MMLEDKAITLSPSSVSRRLLVNDTLSALPDHVTFWNNLRDWFACDFIGGNYSTLAARASTAAEEVKPSLIIRNASYFPPINASIAAINEACQDCNGPMARCGKHGPAGEPPIMFRRGVPTISLLQDIFESGVQKEIQEEVIKSSRAVVFNSMFTASKYGLAGNPPQRLVIPLPVDFTLFAPQNRMGLQQEESLPDGCVVWVGASKEAGYVKGWDVFYKIVRLNPDIPFVAVFKDAAPPSTPPNLRTYAQLTHEKLARIMGACRVGLCTSRTESQHLAGIEMGGCGLTLVVPPVGCYWQRKDLPGYIVADGGYSAVSSAIRAALANPGDPDATHDYWAKEFAPSIVRAAWSKLIEEIECSGQS